MRSNDAPFFAGTAGFALPVMFAFVFLALHVFYLPQSLEDLDSINFALGVRHFDVAEHQPHPPGYPLFILLAKTVNKLTSSEVAALSLLSMLAGAIGIAAIAALVRCVADNNAAAWPLAATLVAITSPLYWFTAARPLSDVPGLAAAIAVQAMTLAASTPRMLYAAGFCAALATGVRSQVAWLTVPLIVFRLAQRFTVHRRSSSPASSVEILKTSLAFTAGVLVWAVPLVVVTGGPLAYWHALSFQGSADLGNIQMLWTRHDARSVADAFYYAFVAPWATWPSATVVLLLATAGFVVLCRRSRASVVVLTLAFGPYFVFDLLFQETFTSRYALPLVIPIACFAVAGARLLPWRAGLAVVGAVVLFDAHAGGTSLAAYARQKAPAFRLLDDLTPAAQALREAPVLAMDRKQSFDFRRPIVWAGGALPRFGRILPAPPQHEWLEPVKYWTGGGRAPVWFVVDPRRTSIDLVQHDEPTAYRWPLPYPVLVGGVRPDEMDFYRVDSPDWFVGEGWALTPEAAGVAEADHRGPSYGPIEGWISTRRVFGGVMMIGGRNFSSGTASITFEPDHGLDPFFPTITAPPGSFLRMFPLPNPSGVTIDYVKFAVRVSPGTRVAIEQFDSGRRTIFGYGDGWHEPEFNPRTGRRWRWLSERGELRFAPPTPRLTLHVDGESPRTYFSRGSRLVARAGDRVIFDDVLTSDFALNIPVPDGTEVVTLETDQVFQPADRSRRSADRRHLGLRVFKCELRPVS